jgi:hypothetical protein
MPTNEPGLKSASVAFNDTDSDCVVRKHDLEFRTVAGLERPDF